ncbi:MAG: 4Fe-4S dicluster domain-containing protein [Cyclobacteriaceae bacterium]
MTFIPQIAFLLLMGVFVWLISKRVGRIRSNINLGREAGLEKDPQRWINVLLIALGQKKMFKNWIPALLHLFIYVGFILINVEFLEIILDGILGTHRLFAPVFGGFYSILISFFEVLVVLVMASCVAFLWRRNVSKVKRFSRPEMKGWPTVDANLILIIELVLMVAILSMNAADLVLQSQGVEHYASTGSFLVSSRLMPIFSGLDSGTLVLVERLAWWLHITGIFAFALYVTYSKHLHIFMAFPNTYFGRLTPKGQMEDMDEVTNEVKLMLGLPVEGEGAPPPEGFRFGAKDVTDLSWKNIMDAYACTECGRCSAECPANLTGKKLSPRKIMMDTRDRAEEIGQLRAAGKESEVTAKSLLEDYILKEEINACTSCNACVEACPVTINPLDIILQMRSYVAMEESASPASWNAMFQNVETNFAPWKFSAQDRFAWAEELKNS